MSKVAPRGGTARYSPPMGTFGRLRVTGGEDRGAVFHLDRIHHSLGRSLANDLRISDATVSRSHAEFRCGPGGVVISNLSMSNPTLLNGKPLAEAEPLDDGDRIQCGEAHIVFEAGGGTTSGSVWTAHPMLAGAPVSEPVALAPCPSCGRMESVKARFCGDCGLRLSPGAAAGGAGAATVLPPPPPGAPPRMPAETPPPPPPPASAEPPRVPTTTFAAMPAPEEPLRTSTATFTGHALGLPPRPAGPAASPGMVIRNRYDLKVVIGEGRAGTVFEGVERESGRAVAVRILRSSRDPSLADQFYASGNALLVSSHPRFVRIHEVGEHGEFGYVAMALLKGTRLSDEMASRTGPSRAYKTAEVGRIGDALAAALETLKGIAAHGNLRPENVWVGPHGEVTLMDPGLAAAPGETVKWPAGGDLRAFAHTAPEVFAGGPPDARSDQYSLAAILFELFSRMLPVGVAPPLVKLRADVPPHVAVAIERALSTRPEDRFPDMTAFRKALAGEGVVPPAPPPEIRWRVVAAAFGLLAATILWAFGGEAIGDGLRKATRDRDLEARLDASRFLAVQMIGRIEKSGDSSDRSVLMRARELMSLAEDQRRHWRLEEAEKAYAEAVGSLAAELARMRDLPGGTGRGGGK